MIFSNEIKKLFKFLESTSPNQMRKLGMSEKEIELARKLDDVLLLHYYDVHGEGLAKFLRTL